MDALGVYCGVGGCEHLFGAAVSLGCGCIGGRIGTGRINAVYERRDSSGRVARL